MSTVVWKLAPYLLEGHVWGQMKKRLPAKPPQLVAESLSIGVDSGRALACKRLRHSFLRAILGQAKPNITPPPLKSANLVVSRHTIKCTPPLCMIPALERMTSFPEAITGKMASAVMMLWV